MSFIQMEGNFQDVYPNIQSHVGDSTRQGVRTGSADEH